MLLILQTTGFVPTTSWLFWIFHYSSFFLFFFSKKKVFLLVTLLNENLYFFFSPFLFLLWWLRITDHQELFFSTPVSVQIDVYCYSTNFWLLLSRKAKTSVATNLLLSFHPMRAGPPIETKQSLQMAAEVRTLIIQNAAIFIGECLLGKIYKMKQYLFEGAHF